MPSFFESFGTSVLTFFEGVGNIMLLGGRTLKDVATGNIHWRNTFAQLSFIGVDSLPIAAFSVIGGRHRFAGSGIGGIQETQEMLDFCAERGIACDIEMIRIDQVNDIYERMLKGDVRYRFVIDMASLKQ